LGIGQAEIRLDRYCKNADDLAVDEIEGIDDHENEHDVGAVRRRFGIHSHHFALNGTENCDGPEAGRLSARRTTIRIRIRPSRLQSSACYRDRPTAVIMLQRNKDAPAVTAMSKPRIIRKYANRRLYDTEASRHINKEDVRKLIASGKDVRIVDEGSGDDITRSVLLQLVAEQELGGQPVLSDQMLTQIIRFYDHPMQGMLGSYLQQSFESFLQQQSTLQEQMQEMMTSGPFAVMKDVAKQNMEAWQAMQKAFLDTKAKKDHE
jgi:polyhydroxyalkanoate synthesis repressor PhaR